MELVSQDSVMSRRGKFGKSQRRAIEPVISESIAGDEGKGRIPNHMCCCWSDETPNLSQNLKQGGEAQPPGASLEILLEARKGMAVLGQKVCLTKLHHLPIPVGSATLYVYRTSCLFRNNFPRKNSKRPHPRNRNWTLGRSTGLAYHNMWYRKDNILYRHLCHLRCNIWIPQETDSNFGHNNLPW
jgi:hypothetical protein